MHEKGRWAGRNPDKDAIRHRIWEVLENKGVTIGPAWSVIPNFVGADTAAVILSEAPHLQEQMTLIIDVGTNAEIVLGNNERLLAASSPTGPAFEGAH